MNEINEAIEIFIKILNRNPLFWSVWIELNKMLFEFDIMESLTLVGRLRNHWAKNFILASFFLENVKIHERFENYCYEILMGLFAFFPESSYLLNQMAVLFHNISDYENSTEFFFKLFSKDPFRYENTDILSNILYVKERQNDLGKLAITCFENEKYIPETCCVLGNYYSLIGEHQKAALYFKRAISLDKNFLSAYTLLGHEYLELKNVSSAIEAYNSAVQINKRDFRAWYGLGQAYELQNYLNFATYYFKQALASNPKDSRMWNAVGNCSEKIGKKEEAVKCFEKSEGLKDQEGISLFQLGKLYDMIGLKKKAVLCFEENLKKKENLKIVDKEYGETLLYLTNFYKQHGDLEKSMVFATKLLDFTGVEKQEAQNIIHELNNSN